MFLSRTMCDVLEEMRKTYESRNFAGLLGLIEEVQTMGNRMEAAIDNKNNYESYRKQAKKAEEELEELRDEIDKLKKEAKKIKEGE